MSTTGVETRDVERVKSRLDPAGDPVKGLAIEGGRKVGAFLAAFALLRATTTRSSSSTRQSTIVAEEKQKKEKQAMGHTEKSRVSSACRCHHQCLGYHE